MNITWDTRWSGSLNRLNATFSTCKRFAIASTFPEKGSFYWWSRQTDGAYKLIGIYQQMKMAKAAVAAMPESLLELAV